jgi:hypothetical protein
LSKTSDAGQNLVGRPGPDEGFRTLVVTINVFANGRLQFFHASEYATTNPLVGDFGEPALHQVDPGTVGWGEIDMKVRSFGEPLPDARRFVRVVVVQDDMNSCPVAFVVVRTALELPGLSAAWVACDPVLEPDFFHRHRTPQP